VKQIRKTTVKMTNVKTSKSIDSLLSFGAAGGLVLLALNTSSLLASFLGSVLGWTWLMGWCKGSKFSSTTRLDGKIAVVTGANTGIGKETAKGLAARGAKVILACRNLKKAEAARNDILAALGLPASQISVMELDLASFASVRQFCKELAAKTPKLDILVNNAGMAFDSKTITIDGQE